MEQLEQKALRSGFAAERKRREMRPKFTREITFAPAYDSRDQNRGIGAAIAIFILRGPKGAITWDLSTGWYRHTDEVEPPTPMGIDYHKPRRRKPGEEVGKGCAALQGRPCKSEGTACSEHVYYRLLQDGTDGVWEELEKYYVAWLDPPKESIR